MSNLSLSNGEESDLYIFKGMEGFESSNDSELVALLDDLHEDTLMTLLDDNLFVQELCEHPFQGEDEQFNPSSASDTPLRSVDTESNSEQSQPSEYLNSIKLEGNKRLNENVQVDSMKRAKLDMSDKQSSALASVVHDHCYALLHEDQHNSSANSDEEASNEESSGSDTGMDVNCIA
jgi:hypothetical protein